MPHYKLISFKLCPFVQRSVITLLEKGVEYDIEYIDLADKPRWFLDVSPFGKVPVLVVDDDVVIFESAVINEYLDEVTPEPRLHPEDPLRRAHNRAWIEFGSSLLTDQFHMMMAAEEDQARTHLATLHDKLRRIEAQLGEGPYFNGARISLVDSALAPMLQRARWVADLVPDFDPVRGLPRVQAWQEALLARPSVQHSTVDTIVDLFGAYLRRPRANLGDRPSFLGARAA